ncbi:SMAX1-like 6 [Hibiscus trionum]|uniref:SMAX1-like 6 n=1 Tax=Hibiscus trionum TaxID=183268 RepID=A0A9W7HQ23_HIBTR|nr:SMAX1-like 6 [Hibiscus trionum]
MPTAVIVARQCLAPEAATALDEAVAVARRRGHAQTTSLHAVSALLTPRSSSALRDACTRARNVAFPPRHQFKALELCISVSLDRVPSGQLTNDPPVSNSLMAAIKRSQANQRRQPPHNFHVYRDIAQQNNSVKVELQHLILSILDDPVVSRVFGEAGFRSSEIKLAIIRPLPNLLRHSRPRGPPVFLCNLENPDPDSRSFSFPFPGFASYSGEGNCKRIGEVLARRKNPLLVGVCAYDALASFTEKNKDGLNIICIENYITKCINQGFKKVEVDSKFEEMGRVVEREMGGSGVVVNYGALEIFGNERNKEEEGGVGYLVGHLTRLLQVHEGNVWFLGAATSYQTYLKFICRFPSLEKHWDLQILPISSLHHSYPKSSLMESFVPFGGLFPTPSESKGSLSGSYQPVPPRCRLCSERCEQEVVAVTKGGFDVSVADQYQSTLPSWLQMAELGANNGLYMKTKDDGQLLNIKIARVQKKWDDICRRLHHTHQVPESNTYRWNPRGHCSNNTNENSCLTANFLKTGTMRSDNPSSVVSKTKNGSLLSKIQEKPSEGSGCKALEPISLYSLSNSSVGNVTQASPTSVTSVTTDLGLGLCSVSSSNKLMKSTSQNCAMLARDFSGCLPANIDVVNGSGLSHRAQSSSSSSPDFGGLLDPSDFKKLFAAVTKRVGWQDEAATVICQTVANGRARNGKCQAAGRRGDIWLNFSGPDRCGKKKIAIALADVIYGDRENFIDIDLSSEDGVHHFDLKFRGKTLVDYVADELSKNPFSVVFLENVDKADIHVLSSLSQAIRTSKFPDSHGREVSANNAIFVTTSTLTIENQVVHCKTQTLKYSEDNILRAKGWPLQMLIKQDDNTIGQDSRPVSVSKLGFVNKRKLTGSNETTEQHEITEMVKRANRTSCLNLDLNIPAEETNDGTIENDFVPENTTPWLQHFFEQPVENVVFKPFDFDALAQKVSDEMNQSFRASIGSDCSLEIDPKVMEQLLAAAYLSDNNNNMVVTDWIEKVVTKGFAEVEKKYNLDTHCIVKLVPDHNSLPSEKPVGISLPSKIRVS